MSKDLKSLNTSLNAIVSYVDMEPLAAGPLANWEVAIKDNFNLKGTLTTASCRLLENHRSIYTATAVDALIKSGANIVAKTSMDELGMGGTNLTAATGPVFNPYDASRISGGSSGGSAALIAAQGVRLAMGTDTGDSIRKPAAFCGVVGVKPSYGRISRYGVIPYASSLDHVGYFTHNVADAALALEVLAGRDDKDMTSSFEPVEAYSNLLDMDLEGKRIGIFQSVQETIQDPLMLEAFNACVQKLQDKGAIVVEKTMDKELLRLILPVYRVISNAEAVANHANLDGVRYGKSVDGETLEAIMTNTRSQGFSTMIKGRFIYGSYALDDDNQELVFNKAKRVRRILVDKYKAMMEDVDIMLALASSQIAPKVEGSNIDEASDQNLIAENHMVINNFSGYPSMTLPLTLVEGMPIGINITAKPFEESTMFAYAQQMETLIDWKGMTI